jgi:membrane protease YdiL (CAAX protease family)
LGVVGGQGGTTSVNQYFFGDGIFITTVVFQCVNPFFEELIVRAYLITEVRQLTRSSVTAVVCSTALQTGYHLYQGIPLALAAGAMFLLWSVYYAKTNRIMPVILAHFYFDAGATLWYFLRHD